jgi:small subunit ribosomal protein S8
VYFSKKVENVLNVLLQEGYINKVEKIEERKGVLKLKVYLRYEGKDNNPVISEIKVISKPGKKVFKSYRDLDKICGGLGVTILSTPKGVMVDKEAKDKKSGGEILCNVF